MISVIMGVYNVEKYVGEAIESILNQTYKDFEFIIIEDCPTDSTPKILQKYAQQDGRIKIIKNPKNIGLTRSLNKALNEAKGEYIARMDADDIAHPERFARQMDFLERNKDIVVLGTSAVNINEDGKVVGDRDVPLTHEDIKKTIRIANPMIHPSVIFRKEQIKKIGNYNSEFRVVQDYELWFRCLANNYKMANLPDRLLFYRVNDKYLERKSFKYRMTDFKVRWKGYKELKLPLYQRYGIIIPLFLGLAPKWLLKFSYRYLKKMDPR